MYSKGHGVHQSDKEAVTWYRKAADQGHVNAQFNLGVKYVNGQGVPKSDKEALKWYQKAANQGHIGAKAAFERLKLKQKDSAASVPASPSTGCANCGISTANLRGCSRCKAIFYCSKECQVAHWKSEHKAACMS